jgi:hypothetical protein
MHNVIAHSYQSSDVSRIQRKPGAFCTQLKDNRSRSVIQKQQLEVLNEKAISSPFQRKADNGDTKENHDSAQILNASPALPFGHINNGLQTVQLTKSSRPSITSRTNHLHQIQSLNGHVMYARDQRITTRKAGRRAARRAPKRPVKKTAASDADRNRFFTHTEGHYVRTLNKANLKKRVHVDEKNKIMTHILQGRLDMCTNCQRFLLPELQRKYPDYTHQIHYSFNDLTGSRTFWTRKKRGRQFTTRQRGGSITRYNESAR